MTIPTAAAPDRVSLSHCLLDADGAVIGAEAADQPYYAASTIKLHVLLAALRAADHGELELNATVAATRTFTGSDRRPFTLGGDHLDATHPADGAPVTIRELLMRMIDRSSNEATDHVIELLGKRDDAAGETTGPVPAIRGLGAVAEAIASLGLASTRVERLIGDGAALDAGATNETSAADLAVTVRALVEEDRAAVRAGGAAGAATGRGAGAAARGRGAVLSTVSRELAREALGAQRIPVIARSLLAGVAWGSKSGWVDGYRHDVAFIGDPGGREVRYLAVMTAGLAPDEADEWIAQRVRELLADLAL